VSVGTLFVGLALLLGLLEGFEGLMETLPSLLDGLAPLDPLLEPLLTEPVGLAGELVAPFEWSCDDLRSRSCADADWATATLSTSSGLITQTASDRADSDRADSDRPDSRGGSNI
jgi:hypothetical protein